MTKCLLTNLEYQDAQIFFRKRKLFRHFLFFRANNKKKKIHIHIQILNTNKGMQRAHEVYQCYYCNKFFIRLKRQERHSKNCSGIPGIVYNFNNQNLISYQDNFNAKGDVPFVTNFDFETTAPTFNLADPEQTKMFVVSYVMIVAFHSKLDLDRIIIQRSFAHSIEQLTTLDYFTREQLSFVDSSLIKMLKDMAFEVTKRLCKNSVGKMFSIESALVKKTLLKWFNQRVKRKFKNIDSIAKL